MEFYLILYLKSYSFTHFHFTVFPHISPAYPEFSFFSFYLFFSIHSDPTSSIKPFRPLLLMLTCISLTNTQGYHFRQCGFWLSASCGFLFPLTVHTWLYLCISHRTSNLIEWNLPGGEVTGRCSQNLNHQLSGSSESGVSVLVVCT